MPRVPGFPRVSLFFNLPELTETVRQHELEYELPYFLGSDAIKCLFDASHGHPGVVRSMLYFIYEKFHSEWCHTGIAERPSIMEISPDTFLRYTSDTDMLLQSYGPGSWVALSRN